MTESQGYLKPPPAYEPIKCGDCGKPLTEEEIGNSTHEQIYWMCSGCVEKEDRALGRGLAMDTRFPVDQLEKDEGGVRNLCAILDDQPYQNSTFTVAEIRMILDSYGLEPDEAVIWFRARRR